MCTGWVRLKNLARARLPGLESLQARSDEGLESLEAGSDEGLESLEAGSGECLEDVGSVRLNVSYSTVSGGSWEASAKPRSVVWAAPLGAKVPQMTVSWRRSVVWGTPIDVS